jgi:hypothetical protein
LFKIDDWSDRVFPGRGDNIKLNDCCPLDPKLREGKPKCPTIFGHVAGFPITSLSENWQKGVFECPEIARCPLSLMAYAGAAPRDAISTKFKLVFDITIVNLS